MAAQLKLITIAALFVGCSAFLPQGNLRAQAPAAGEILQQPAVAPLSPPAAGAGPTGALAATAAVGLAAAALALGAAQQRRPAAPRGALTRCRVAGITFPITEKFDPMNLGNTDAKMARYTDVEIKHGRISMIACVGYALPEFGHFPGCEKFGDGLSALNTLPVEGWLQLVAFIGAHEVLVKPREGGMGGYDFGLGTELLEGCAPVEVERRQTVERNNGRLAMIGIMGLMVQDGLFGKTPVALLKSDGWWGPSVDWFLKDLPLCQAGVATCAMKPRTAMRAAATGSIRFKAQVDGEEQEWVLGPPGSELDTTGIKGALEPCWSSSGRSTMNVNVIVGKEDYPKSPALPFLDYPEHLAGWVGGEKGFDPMGVTDFMPVYFCREAELKHGRVCMLATLGWIATDLGARFPAEMFQNVSTIQAHDKMVENGIMGPGLAFLGILEIYGGYLWFNGEFGKIKRDAGDFFVGKNFLPKDEEKARDMKLKELENGRLAMLAFAGICTQASLFDKTWPFF